MKAAVFNEFGDVSVFTIENVPTPKPKAGHVLVKVLAAGVNRLDDYIRAGTVVPELAFPHILGADAAGEVFELGAGVTGFDVGERVIVAPGYATDDSDKDIRPTVVAPSFALPGLHIAGTYAQYIEVPARAVVKDETGLSPEEAATLPVVLATSVHALKGIAAVGPGDKVLIHAGASGSGSMLIQVARALGAEVATTIRNSAKEDFVKHAGANLVINVREEDLVQQVQEWTGGNGVDVVIDNLSGSTLAKSIEAVKAEGMVVAFGFAGGPEVSFDIRSLFFAQKQIKGSMASDIEDLEWGLKEVRAGNIRPLLDRALPLEEVGEAHRLIANSEIKGNIVLLPWAA